MKKIALKSVLLLGVIAFTFNSCKKEEPDTETQSSTDNSLCEGEFSRVFPETNNFAINEPGVHRIGYSAPNPYWALSTCAIVTVDTPNAYPVVMTIDYGTGCAGPDGKTREGKLVVTISDDWDNTGAIMTIDPQNYKVTPNGGAAISFDGTVSITKNSSTSYTFAVANGRCWNASWNIDWNCSRTFTQTAGVATTTDPFDDEFTTYGSANGTNRNGKTFDVNVSSGDPIVRKMNCQWISDGTFEITPQDLATRTVDFGYPNNGACDDKATLTIKGNTFEFTMQ